MSAGVASHSLYCSKSAPILFDLLIIPANAPGVNFAVASFNRLHILLIHIDVWHHLRHNTNRRCGNSR